MSRALILLLMAIARRLAILAFGPVLVQGVGSTSTLIPGVSPDLIRDPGAQTSRPAAGLPGADLPVRARAGFVDVGQDLRIRYVARGAQDPTRVVLFLHGYSDSSYSFQEVTDRLDPSLQAIALDLRGHGESSKPVCCYAIQDFANDVVAFMDARGIKSATIVGHSMGSLVAQRVAIQHPGRVSTLVLVGAAPTFKDHGMDELVGAIEGLTDPVDRKFVTEFQASTVYAPLPAGQLDRYVDVSMKLTAGVWRAVMTGILDVDHRADLGKIRARTLLAWGDRDSMATRADQDLLAKGIPGATLSVYKDIGHALHWEAPARFTKELNAFVRGEQISRR